MNGFCGWIPGIGDLVISLDAQNIIKAIFPQGFGMICFPDNAWNFDQASAQKGNFSVNIDRSKNTMTIETGGFGPFGTKEQMAWNLSGWTSRYGKPVELSLALHLSTMAPDFAYNFCMDKDLQTLVTIYTHKMTYNIEYTYRKDGFDPFYKNDKLDSDGNVEEGIITTYEKLSENKPHYYRIKRLFTKDIELEKDNINYTKENGYEIPILAPIDIISNGTSIISIEENGNKKYYKAVDADGKPISFWFEGPTNNAYGFNGNNSLYSLEYKDGKPYFTQINNSSTTPDINTYNWLANSTIEVDGKKVTLEILSLSDLARFLDKNNDASDELYKSIAGDDNKYVFARYNRYIKTLEEYDKFINNTLKDVILNNEKEIFAEEIINNMKQNLNLKENSLKFKYNGLDYDYSGGKTIEKLMNDWIYRYVYSQEYSGEKDSKYYYFYNNVSNYPMDQIPGQVLGGGNATFQYTESKDIKIDENYNHLSKLFFNNVFNQNQKNSTTMSEDDRLSKVFGWIIKNDDNSLIKWITKEVQSIEKLDTDYNMFDKTVNKIFEESMKDVIEKYGLGDENGENAFSELETVYYAFKDLSDEFETYKPYIKEVTHHWYKDLDFGEFKDGDDNESVYEAEENNISKTGEFKPAEDSDSYESINALKDTGAHIEYIMTNKTNDIKQTKQPKIYKDKSWHYKVKNWLAYGYYFIYDGTTASAKKINEARSILTAYDENFDPGNPLLINTFFTINLDENAKQTIQKELYEGGISGNYANAIEAKANEYNKVLKDNESEVRLQRINFEKKSSLEAFSILEGMHTVDSEYIYRDLKEFLIELGYFTRADFESIESDVFKWIIPSYNVYKDEWPDAKYEIDNNQYGVFVRSKKSLDEEKIAEEKEKEENGENGNTTIETKTSTSNKLSDEEAGYTSSTTVNGITYRNYKQYLGNYAKNAYFGGTMSDSGCGPTSAAVMLSGYGADTSPWDVAKIIKDKYDNTTSKDNLAKALNNLNFKTIAYSVNSSDLESDIKNIEDALISGKPVLVGGSFSSAGHWICLIGMENSKAVISDVGDVSSLNTYNGYIEVNELVNRFLINGSYIIPDKAPTEVSIKQEVVGFKAELDIIAPESGVIKEVYTAQENSAGNASNNNKTNYFTTNGNYVIIEFTNETVVKGWKMKIEGLTVDTATLQEGQEIKKGDIIGKTNEGNIKIILYDDKDAILNNVEGYFKLPIRKSNSLNADNYEFFYYTYYEPGLISRKGAGPESVGACIPGTEHGVGICQWTTVRGGISNIQKVCEKLYNLDSSLCAPLQKYIGMSNDELIDNYAMSPSFENSQLRQDFSSICATDREKFLQLQMQIAMEEKYEIFEDLGLSWIKDRPYAVQGTLAAFVNWGPDLGWENCINESMNDEEIIIALSKYALPIPSSVGTLETRWNAQAKAAIDILNGEIDAEKFLTDANYAAPYATNGQYINFLSTR